MLWWFEMSSNIILFLLRESVQLSLASIRSWGVLELSKNNYMYYEYLDFAWRHHDAYLYESKDGILAMWRV